MTLAPGSVSWLLAHELRLTLREMMGKARAGKGGGKRRWIFGLVFLGVLALTVGVPLGLVSRKFDLQPDAVTVAMITAAIFVAFTLMLAQTLSAATMALYQRGDLDLLFSSPLDPRRTLAVRITALAGSSAWLMLLLVTPALVPAAIIGGHWNWLAVYPVLAVTALLASVTGTALSMSLFALLGARRTRTVAQVLGALIGAAVFLVSQAHAILGGDRARSGLNAITDWARTHDLSSHPVLSLPARAALGEPLALMAVIVTTIAVFTLAAISLGARFASTAASVTGVGPSPSRHRPSSPVRFGGGPPARLLQKELTLILRDPALISQVLLQILYLAPASFLLVNSAMRSDDAGLAPVALGAGAVVFLAGQLAGGLGWVTVSGEDAPDLIRSAPVTPARIGQFKAAAVMIMVMGLLAVPLGLLVWFQPLAGVIAILGAASCAGAVACIEYWLARPGKRSDFRHRQASGGMFVTFAELALSLMIAAATSLTILFGAWGLIPAVVAVLILYLLSRKARDAYA